MNERIRLLRNRFLDSPRQVDIERAVLVTESSKKTEGRPVILRRAAALETILSHMSVTVRDEELIVGNHARNIRGVPLFPEYAADWILDQMDDFMTRKGDRFLISEDQKTVLRSTLPYWKGKSLRDKAKEAAPETLREVLSHGVIRNENYTMSGPGHMVPDYAHLLSTGLGRIAADCGQAAAALDKEAEDYNEKRDFFSACSMSAEAIIGFARRYADAAEALISETSGFRRKEELRVIAETCRHVPEHPARSFQEALQFVLFIQLALQLEANGLAIAPGRLDRTLYPYYRHSRDGGMDRNTAKELVECFYIKLGEIDKIYSNEATRYLQGPGHGQCITIGGVDETGKDSTNDLSLLLLEADHDVRLVQPDIALRIHEDTPQYLLETAVSNIREGLNKVKVFSDKVVTESLLGIGVSREDSWDFAFLGCSEPAVQGKMNTWGNSGHMNLAKCLELAMNDGICMLSGKRMGPATGSPEGFAAFDELLAAFQAQVKHFIPRLVEWDNILDKLQAETAPLPVYSLATRGCVERGIEFNRGGAVYNTTSPLGVGPITVGDSLAAVRKLVFEDKRISMGDLREALKIDFAGNEPLRLMLQNRAPKFGNDSDYADELSNFVLRTFCDGLRLHTNTRGGPFIGGLYYLSANIPYGLLTAATPDGRKKGEPLNDGGISPSHGMDKNGATAVAKSVGKLENHRVPHGCVLNQRFHPSVFSGEGKTDLFIDYIRTFVELGGWECQYNVVTTEHLRRAQIDPAEFKSLVVRVAGYSAYFTELQKELQNDIIARTELTAV